MRQIQFAGPGAPTHVVTCAEVAAPAITEPGEVLVRVDLFPINPADLLTLQGLYVRSDPQSPRLGIEATGVIEAVGTGVTDLAPGDRVLLLGTDLWSELVVTDRTDVVPVASSTSIDVAATLKVNPATAALLLREFVSLSAGDWIVQNAANSAVGRAVDRIARHRGISVVNLIRRPELIDELSDRPTVLLDDGQVADRIVAATGGAPVRLALDAVMGASGSRLPSVVADHGSVVVYGASSGEPLQLDPIAPVFRGVQVHGFWLTGWLAKADADRRRELYADLEKLSGAVDLTPPIESTYSADEISMAVERAITIGARGKVAVRF